MALGAPLPPPPIASVCVCMMCGTVCASARVRQFVLITAFAHTRKYAFPPPLAVGRAHARIFFALVCKATN